MKKYLLLRDNHKSGPWDLEKLSSLGLKPLDLIWIEKESTCWKNPDEIEELKSLVKNGVPFTSEKIPTQRIYVSLPEDLTERNFKVDEAGSDFFSYEKDQAAQQLVKPREELRANGKETRQKKPVWTKKIFQHAHGANIIAIFVGVVFGAFVIKKLVDGVVNEAPAQTAVATTILENLPEKKMDENIRNALVTEIVPVYKAPIKKTKKTNIKGQLKLNTNNYKVGLFGGINGLQLTVFNTSGQHVEKALVVLDYLRSNGEVVQSENVLFKNIKPGKAQTISIPGSNRGVKVKYKVMKVSSHDYKPDIREI